MSSDPRDLLHRAAQAPSTPLDATRMLRRARQLRRRRAGAGAVMLVALALPAAAALAGLPADEVRFADPASTPDPATPPAEPAGDGCGPMPEPPPAPADADPTPSAKLPPLDENAAAVVIDTAPEGVTLADDAGTSPTSYELVFDDPAGGGIRVGVLSEEGDSTRRAIRNGAVAHDDVTTVEQWPSDVCAAVVSREDFTQIVFVAGGTTVNMMDGYPRPNPGPALLGVDELRAWGQRIAAVLTAPSPGQTDELDPGRAGDAGVVVELDRSTVTPGEHITATMTHARGPQLHTGARYNLERFHDGQWHDVAGVHDQIRGPVRPLKPGGSLSDWIDTSELVAGRYRFTKVFMTADGEQISVIALFEVMTHSS